MTRRTRDERGSISVWLAASSLVMMILVGLAVDLGGQVHAKQRAHDIAAEGNRGQSFNPPLSDDELAFFDAVAANRSAVELQGNDVLADIARELVRIMQRDTKYDWTVRDDVRAKLRSSVKRVLVKFKYPPDKQPEAIRIVIEQMEALAPAYAASHAGRSS